MADGRRPIVVGIGEALMDRFMEYGSSGVCVVEVFGGAPSNFVYHASQCLGCRGVVVSAVGPDERGKRILASMEAKGLEFMGVEVPYESGVVNVKLVGGKNCYEIVEKVAWDYIRFDKSLKRLAAETDAVCFGTLAQRNSKSADAIRAFVKAVPATAKKIFDANFRAPYYGKELFEESLGLCNILKISDDELKELCSPEFYGCREDTFCSDLMARFSNLELIVLTCGSDGSRLFRRAEAEIVQPGKSVRLGIGTTVGAGDSFTGAFCAALLAGLDAPKALAFASEIATFVCGHREATPEYDAQTIGMIGEYGVRN